MKTYKVKLNQAFKGRGSEQARLQKIAEAKEASIVVVYGRRRIGKTELIEQTFRNRNLLKFEGIEGKDEAFQKHTFLLTLTKYTGDTIFTKLAPQISWFEIFESLANFVKKGRWTIYFEELQWLANYKSDLISELKPVWDNQLRHNNQILLVLCGSSPSYFTSQVLQSRALHNRAMHEFKIEEFTIKEAAGFFGKRSTKELFNAYLTVGGIPQYLKLLTEHSSAYLGICNNSFLPNSFFLTEYERILVSSFATSELFKQLLNQIGLRRFATREDLLKSLQLASSGGVSSRLEELENCGFIASYRPLSGHSQVRKNRYEINDAYLRFYFNFILPIKREIQAGDFVNNSIKPLPLSNYMKLLGLSFERFCRRNSSKIAERLGFSAVQYTSGANYQRSKQSDQGNFQIDLMYQRKDKVWTICETKYQEAPVDRSIILEFGQKLQQLEIPTDVSIHKVLISSSGVANSLVSQPYFDRILTLEDLI